MKISAKGFTIMEVIVSILIFSFVIFFVFELIVSGYRYYLITQQRTLLLNLGQQEMEQLRRNVLALPKGSNPANVATWTDLPANSNYQYKASYYYYQSTELVGIQLLVRGPMQQGVISPAGTIMTLDTLVAHNSPGVSPTPSPPPPPAPPPTPPTPPPLS